MRNAILTAIFFSLAALSGCCYYEVCNLGGREMCVIQNSGWKILNFIPIASGNPDMPNLGNSIWFADTVDLDSNMKILDLAMRRHHATGLKDLSSFKTEEQIFVFLLKRYTLHTSAEILK